MTSDVTVNSALQSAANTQSATTKLAEDFTQFLNLLTIQLQNQDPLNPMDTNEFTNQLVAFTGVEQQINTNQKLDNLVGLGLSSSLPTTLNYVGMDASYISSEFYFDGDTDIEINYTAPGSANTTINIFDANGELVFSKQVSDDEQVERFVWDGIKDNGQLAEPGTYEVSVDALDQTGQAVDTSTVVSGRIKGVETQNGVLFLLIGERAVPVSQVINVKNPDSELGSIEAKLDAILEFLNPEPETEPETEPDEGDGEDNESESA